MASVANLCTSHSQDSAMFQGCAVLSDLYSPLLGTYICILLSKTKKQFSKVGAKLGNHKPHTCLQPFMINRLQNLTLHDRNSVLTLALCNKYCLQQSTDSVSSSKRLMAVSHIFESGNRYSASPDSSCLLGTSLLNVLAYPEFSKYVGVLLLVVVPETVPDERNVGVGT